MNIEHQQNKTKRNWLKSLSFASLLLIGMSCSTDENLEGITPENEMTTLSARLNTAIEAEDYDGQSGIQTVSGWKVGYVNNDDWIRFDDFDYDGATSVSVNAASNTSGGTIEFRAGSATGGDLLGSVSVTGTGGWSNMQTFTATINDDSSNSDLYVVFKGGSGSLLDLDNFTFTNSSTSSGNDSFPNMVGKTVRLQSVQSNNYWMSITNRTTGSNTRMVPQTYTGNWPKWVVESVTSGNDTYYRFRNVDTGARFRPVASSNGSSIYMPNNTWTGTWTQWAVESDGNGNYTIKNRGSGTYLSSSNSSFSTPTGVSSLNGNATTWNIVDTDGNDINGEGGGSTGNGNTPYDVLGLDRWKITLPKDEGGDSDADEVFYSQSDNDYSGDAALPNYSDEFFYVSNGNVVFSCPADYDLPKTSSNTDGTRTELREMPYRSGNEDGWDAGGSTVREMNMRVRVTQTSSTRKLAFAQIHDYGQSNWDDLIRIQIQSDNTNATIGDTGKIYVMGDMAEGLSSEGVPAQSDDDRIIIENYTLGDWMDIRITYNNDTIRIYVNGSNVAAQTYTGADCSSNYFKAGCYNQSMSSSSSGTGVVEIQSLSVTSNF